MDLSDAYAQGKHIPDGDSYPPRWAEGRRRRFRGAERVCGRGWI